MGLLKKMPDLKMSHQGELKVYSGQSEVYPNVQTHGIMSILSHKSEKFSEQSRWNWIVVKEDLPV